jgi:hypothetical protein
LKELSLGDAYLCGQIERWRNLTISGIANVNTPKPGGTLEENGKDKTM